MQLRMNPIIALAGLVLAYRAGRKCAREEEQRRQVKARLAAMAAET